MQTFLLVLCFVILAVAQVTATLRSLRCSGETSCKHRCNDTGWDKITKKNTHCHCDSVCSFYEDCCPDYQEFCANTPQKHNLEECVRIKTEPTHPGIFMITSCAPDWNEIEKLHAREKCQASSKRNRPFTSSNITDDLPVFRLDSPVNYRNRHCAACNRVSDLMLFYWKLKIRCEIRPSENLNNQQKLDFMLKYCPERNLEPENGYHFRYCYPHLNITSGCPVGDNWTYRNSCMHDPTAIVHDKPTQTNYRNYGCFMCNDVAPDDVRCGPSPGQNIFNPKSFDVVMQFRPPIQPQSVKTETRITCAKRQVYDPHLEVCREGLTADPSTAVRDKYRVNVWMTPTSGRDEVLTAEQFREALCKHFALDKQQIDDVRINKEGRSISFLFNLYAGQTHELLQNRSGSHGQADIDTLLDFNSSFELSARNTTWTVFKVTSRQLACTKGNVYGPKEFNITLVEMRVFIYNTSEVLPRKRYYLIRENESTPLDQASVFVCRSSFTVWCPYVLLPIDREEYTLLANNSLLHNTTGLVFPQGEYDVEKTKAWICTNYTIVTDNSANSTTTVIQGGQSTLQETVLRYLTIVGLSLSVLCLLMVLITHCILSELRNPLPGKNLMNLCVSLFLAHFLWLLGSGDTDKKTFCAVTAIALHYFFLVSFTCTTIIAYDTWRTFSSKMSKVRGASFGGESQARFLVYTGLAWGGPIVWVATCAGLDYMQIVVIGYGGSHVCWITNSDAILIAFATPVACALLFNIITFSQTVWAISQAKQQSTKLTTSRHNNSGVIKIYARLVTLMGFSWFFSFSAELIHSSLMYPFVIFSTSQGVYIFLAFICKARVLRMFKDKLQPSRKNKRRPTQYTNSSYAPYRLEDETTM